MGFFSKIKKGIKSGFKSIGKGIKSTFKKFGKFMGKIGIVGQLALMFTPVGAMMGNLFTGLSNAAGGVFSRVTGALAQGGKLAQGASKLLEAGANFAKAGHSAFRTITDGVSSFVGEFSKTALKKIPGMEQMMPSLSSASDTFFKGKNSAWATVQKEMTINAAQVLDNFNKAIGKAPTVTTAAQANIVKAAEQEVAKTATGAKSDTSVTSGSGPLKEDYKFPTDGTVAPKSISDIAGLDNTDPLENLKSRFTIEAPQGPLQGGGTSSFEAYNPNQSSLLGQMPPTKNNLTGEAFTDTLTKKAAEQVADSPMGFFEELGTKTLDAIKSVPSKILEAPEKIVNNLGETVTSAAETRLMQNTGLQAKPEGAKVFYADIPEFSIAPAGSYGSPEINDRAMQLQLNGTDFYQQHSMGAGAHFYVNQMARSIGGSQ